MSDDAILLADVGEAYRSAIAAAGSRRNLRSINVDGEVSEVRSGTAPALIVVEAAELDAERLDKLAALRKQMRQTPTVVLSGTADVEGLFRLARLGVREVVRLPAPADHVAERCLRHATWPDRTEISGLVGRSPAMRALRTAIAAAATSNSSILLTGETGTGKGVVARAIHRLSERREQPFVHVDCSALSPTLIESELFGHERGSFTGAIARRLGRFEQAQGGTIFLDEIGELDLPLQSKFLRVLEDHEFERVGAACSMRMEARVIGATSRDLSLEIASGRFRADLYYRLHVVHMEIPPLRDRLGDLPLLVDYHLPRIAERLGLPPPAVSQQFCDRLLSHSWLGNVRELVNLLEAVMVRARSIDLVDSDLEGLLPSHASGRAWGALAAPLGGEPGADVDSELPDERTRILRLLLSTGGNVARVARRLGMPRSTLRYKIRRYGLSSYIPRD